MNEKTPTTVEGNGPAAPRSWKVSTRKTGIEGKGTLTYVSIATLQVPSPL